MNQGNRQVTIYELDAGYTVSVYKTTVDWEREDRGIKTYAFVDFDAAISFIREVLA